MTWTTPLRPLRDREGWCLAIFPGGLYEFLVTPAEAAWCVTNGVLVDGVRLDAAVVDRIPAMNGVLIRCIDRRQEVDHWVEPYGEDIGEEPPLRAVA